MHCAPYAARQTTVMSSLCRSVGFFCLFSYEISTCAGDAGQLTAKAVPRFGIFEHTFTQQRNNANPYREVTATATFVPPEGRERSIPLFWDGGAQWKVRFSPDAVGEWRWSV